MVLFVTHYFSNCLIFTSFCSPLLFMKHSIKNNPVSCPIYEIYLVSPPAHVQNIQHYIYIRGAILCSPNPNGQFPMMLRFPHIMHEHFNISQSRDLLQCTALHFYNPPVHYTRGLYSFSPSEWLRGVK